MYKPLISGYYEARVITLLMTKFEYLGLLYEGLSNELVWLCQTSKLRIQSAARWKAREVTLPGKVNNRVSFISVPQTDTGELVE